MSEKYAEWMAGAVGNVCSTPERDIQVDLRGVGWLGQNNDYHFIQELCANCCSGWFRGLTHALLQGKSVLPCRKQLKVVQQAISNSHNKDSSDGITESDIEDAAPDSLMIDASDTEVIDIE